MLQNITMYIRYLHSALHKDYTFYLFLIQRSTLEKDYKKSSSGYGTGVLNVVI